MTDPNADLISISLDLKRRLQLAGVSSLWKRPSLFVDCDREDAAFPARSEATALNVCAPVDALLEFQLNV
jgi:hypothetical protein